MESTFASHMERNLLEDSSYSERMDPPDPLLKNLQKKGFEHEDTILASFISEGKNVSILKVVILMAEGGGFEPPRGISSPNDLANRRLQPLGHPSALW